MTGTESSVERLRQAATIIRDAMDIRRAADPIRLATAHRVLREHRHDVTGAPRAAIDVYLDDATWHHGPFVLLNAVSELAHQLDLPNPDLAHIVEQLRLFEVVE